MLWESVEPRAALQERFGLNSFDHAVGWLTTTLAQGWDLEVKVCERIIISDNNVIAWVGTDRGALVAKWSRAQEQFARLTAVADLLRAMHEQGVPVALPLPSVDGQLRLIVSSGFTPLSMTVQPEITGDLLDITDEAAVHQAGACLATLHDALAKYEDSRLLNVQTGPLPDLRQRAATWLDLHDPGTNPAASARLREHVASLPPLDSPRQLIHNDYRAANILMADSEVVAVLDFDSVAPDHRFADLANSFVLLGTRFTNWQPTPAAVRTGFLAGYESVRLLTSAEHSWLQALVVWRSIHAGWADAV